MRGRPQITDAVLWGEGPRALDRTVTQSSPELAWLDSLEPRRGIPVSTRDTLVALDEVRGDFGATD